MSSKNVDYHAGYANPIEAFRCPDREDLAYVTCINAAWKTSQKPDFVATIDLNPESPTYAQIIHKLMMQHLGDELHHSGWNACSSCKDGCCLRRGRLIAPGINSDRIYVIDVASNPRAPEIDKIVDSSDLHAVDASGPHTVHCLPSGDVMVSCLGNAQGNAKGTFVLLEQKTFKVKGTWQLESDSGDYNYDFWYQPRHNIMVSTEWSAPNIFRGGFSMDDVINDKYGHSISFWDWTSRKSIQRIDLGESGRLPLEVRFYHNPDSDVGYVGCALSSTVVQFFKTQGGKWSSDVVIRVPPKAVDNWCLPSMPSLVTDILISLDDRYLYFSNWLHGDVRQYDVSDPKNIRQVGQIFLGGSICKGEEVNVLQDKELKGQPERPSVRGLPVRGGPQMLQLSQDGRRLYVTNSLFSSWDQQFYPENIEKGSMMVLVHVDTEKGGLTLDPTFIVDFGQGVLAHEMRFPGGDSTSDIWE